MEHCIIDSWSLLLFKEFQSNANGTGEALAEDEVITGN